MKNGRLCDFGGLAAKKKKTPNLLASYEKGEKPCCLALKHRRGEGGKKEQMRG